jgi:septation ring formation regulator
MGFVIGTIVIVLGAIVAGYMTRKKYFKEIDRLESWKIDILNRPILGEMSRVKQLNMTGQTEELFERWRREWDDIVAGQLPEVEDLLFDADEFIDKLRFKKAREVQSKIAVILNETEEKIKKILTELDELVGSEQKNREEMDELQKVFRDCKQALLAHRHTFGIAVDALEKQVDECLVKFQEFEEKTEHGDYLEAREVVLMIKAALMEIYEKMELIPKLLSECQTGLPMQLDELKDGYQEMIGQGYLLEHLQFEKEMAHIEEKLQAFLNMLKEAEAHEVEQGIETVNETIEQFYVLLEKEVLSKHYIHQHQDETVSLLTEVTENSKILKEETDVVKQIYHLSEKELAAQKQAEDHLLQLIKRYELLEMSISQQDSAQTHLSEELSNILEMLQNLEQEQKDYRQILHALRKDEISAREKVEELQKKISETIRVVTKSKIPGLPTEYEYLLDDGDESIQTVFDKLAEKPLDIPAVQHYLDKAVVAVEKLATATSEMIENVLLAEKVIQYGNRYKSRYPSVAEELYEAEAAFRSFEYKAALEQAATTIEKIEPGAIKRIEAMMSEEIL